MSNSKYWSGLVVFLLIAFLLNPNEAKHQQAVSGLTAKEFNKAFSVPVSELIGDDGSLFVKVLAAVGVTSQNCVFFSLTKLRADGSTIGIGLFGHVFLFANKLPLGDNDLFNSGGDDEEEEVAAPSAALTVISKDYEYSKSNVDFEFHLENVGNSSEIHNLINNLMYEGMDFDKYVKYKEKSFGEGDPEGSSNYDLTEKYSILCNSDKYIVFQYDQSTYTGGAHGSYGTGYAIINIARERIIGIDEFISQIPDNVIIESNPDISIDPYFRETLWPPDGIDFCGSNVTLLWNPYTIAPYAAGQIVCEIPDNVVSRYLTDEGKAFRNNKRAPR